VNGKLVFSYHKRKSENWIQGKIVHINCLDWYNTEEAFDEINIDLDNSDLLVFFMVGPIDEFVAALPGPNLANLSSFFFNISYYWKQTKKQTNQWYYTQYNSWGGMSV